MHNEWLNDKYCEVCGREIQRLETYITVNEVVVCDDCYLEMGRNEFIELIGGEVLVGK